MSKRRRKEPVQAIHADSFNGARDVSFEMYRRGESALWICEQLTSAARAMIDDIPPKSQGSLQRNSLARVRGDGAENKGSKFGAFIANRVAMNTDELKVARLEIFRGCYPSSNVQWIESVAGLDAAHTRMGEIAAKTPDAYFLFDSLGHALIATIAAT